MSKLTRNPISRTPGGVLLVICLVLLVQLACISLEYVIKVVPEGPDSGRLEMTIAYRLTDEYVQAARQANQELAADYAAANLGSPTTRFPETIQEMDKPDFGTSLGPDYQIVSETATEMVVSGSQPYGPGTGGEPSPVTSYTDENGWTHYVLVMDLPELADEETLAGLDQMRAGGLGPKPEAVPPAPEPAPGEGGMMDGFLAMFAEIGEGLSAQVSLEAWYLQRILLSAGLPAMAYVIEMPGPIQSYTVDGRAAGSVDESGTRFSLVVDEAYIRQIGPGEHQLQLDAAVHPCQAECNTGPHWVWDGASNAGACGCICETGWQPDESGSCVACDDVCRGLDPRAVADPAESAPNSCGCRCDAPLMTWEPGTGCVCMVGAEPEGDGCKCKVGWELSAESGICVPSAGGASKPTSCEVGMTCFANPDLCPCFGGRICDIWSPKRDIYGCSPKVAVFAVSPEVSNYERRWILGKMIRIRNFYRSQGYEIQVVQIQTGDEIFEALGNPSTRALAYFGHAATPTIESSDAGSVERSVHTSLVRRYRAQNLTREQADQAATQRSSAPSLDYAYIHTCHSLDDNTMRDYLVKPGGTFWGKQGLLWAFQDPVETVKPGQ